MMATRAPGGLTNSESMISGKIDPVNLTVHYEMMKLCTGLVEDTMRW